MIVAAAIQYGPLIMSRPAPCRHHDVLHALNQMMGDSEESQKVRSVAIQGFINDEGRFFNRKDAFRHCKKINQPLVRRLKLLAKNPTNYNGDELFSEDLW